jgi:hypothetical protein
VPWGWARQCPKEPHQRARTVWRAPPPPGASWAGRRPVSADGAAAPDFEKTTEELRALAEEVRDRYDLMLKLDLDPEDAPLHREMLDLACETLEDIAMVEAGRGRLVFITPACATPSGSDPASLAIDTALAGAISTAANAGAAGGAAGKPSWARNRLRQLRAAGSHMSRVGI